MSEVKVWGILFPSMGKQWHHQMYMRNTQNKRMTANWPQCREDQCHLCRRQTTLSLRTVRALPPDKCTCAHTSHACNSGKFP